MNNKTWKSLLHEYFQQNGLASPIYLTERIDEKGMDHIPEWKCTIIIAQIDKEFIGISSSKKEAGAICAKKAYEYISNQELPKEILKQLEKKQKVQYLESIPFGNYKEILLVDGENYNLDMSDMNKIKNSMLVLIFAAKNTTKNNIFVLQENNENCYVFLSQSVGKDAADHLLTFTAGQLSILLQQFHYKYYVLTRDHFGEFIGVLMQNCKFVCNLNEININ